MQSIEMETFYEFSIELKNKNWVVEEIRNKQLLEFHAAQWEHHEKNGPKWQFTNWISLERESSRPAPRRPKSIQFVAVFKVGTI